MTSHRSVLCLAALICVQASSAADRRPFDSDWRFALGHAQDAAKDFRFSDGSFSPFGKAGTDAGPIGLGFKDDRWQRVDLPHDWVVSLPFDEKADMMHGFKPIGRAFPENSVGWYRKSFDAPLAWKGKRVRLAFDGVSRDCKVWINGHWIGQQISGSIGFVCDLTDYLKLGSRNVISVRVNASDFEGWYYEGAGIYRHTWLTVSPPIHLADDGVALRPVVVGNVGSLSAEAEIVNETGQPVQRCLTLSLADAAGKAVGQVKGQAVTIPAWGKATAKAALKAGTIKRWSIENPTLYACTATIDGDSIRKSIGFRTFRFDSAKGFFLNDVPTKIKGFCIHQDHAGVGTAVPDSINEWRLVQLKKIGANAIRTSHQAPTPEVIDACDRLGIVVLDENRIFGSTGEALDAMTKLVKRDRNHPSVIFWSLGNEEWGTQNTDESARISATMKRVIAQHDPTRPVTFAANNGAELKGINSVVDVRGINYGLASVDPYHKARPNQPFHFSEVASTVTTRGEYWDDKVKAYVSAYDTQKISWGSSAEAWWKMVLARDWLIGGFVWTGLDYRGEPTPYSWPNISSHFGVLDVCGYPKDVAFYYKAWWTDQPVLHLLPHWNHKGKEGQVIDVWCFSNHDEVELLLNGKSLGRKTMERGGHLEWKVAYQPGALKAIGFRKGVKAQETLVQTVGAPARLVLEVDRQILRANGTDSLPVTIKVLDSLGQVVPDASSLVEVAAEGAGRVIGVGNGDPSCHESDQVFADHDVFDVLSWHMKPLAKGETAETLLKAQGDFSKWPAASVFRNQIHQEGASAAFWARFDVGNPSLWERMVIGPIDDLGEIYLNGKFLGRTKDWAASHTFSATGLRKGANEILILAKNEGGEGGFMGGVSLESRAKEPNWTRSLFHGLGQAIVQSSGKPGSLRITARAEGLKPAEVVITCKP